MKRNFRLLAIAVVAMAATTFTSCNVDDDFMIEPTVQESLQTRASISSEGTIINFDDFDAAMMAGPTSYGANYYSDISSINDPDNVFSSEVNSIDGIATYWNGGIALSKWNYRSNPSSTSGITTEAGTITSDWWYSYNNQMSVYNTNSTDGANTGAGHSGNNFAVVFGYVDDYNSMWMEKASFSFNRAKTLKGLWYCNSSYAYGVMVNGNTFGNVGIAGSMAGTKGYFEVILECYDSNGNLIERKTQKLADYRDGYATVVPVTTWTYWDINISNVKTVKFNFQGSDTGDWGLNTPAYICIDDITIQ